MFNKKIFFAVLIIAILSVTVGSVVGGQDDSNTVYVSPSGNDGNTGTSDAPFKTFKKAVEAVPNGGTVFIKAGLYYAKNGNDNIIIDKDLNIVGEDKETTIIDRSGVGATLNERGEFVRTFLFRSYTGTDGTNQTLKVKNLTFQNQENDAYCSIGISTESTESTVENCNFINNQGTFLIEAHGNAVGTNAELKVLNCSFTNNSMGLAAVYLSGHYSTVAGSSFVNNRDLFAALELKADALVSDSYFSGNIGDSNYANDIFHATAFGTIKLHNNVFIQPRSGGSTRSILNEYGVTEYV